MELIATDEYGYNYAAKCLFTIEDIRQEIDDLDRALDDASTSEAYAIQATINELRQFLAQEQDDQCPILF